jgi:hypothetical protein
LHQHCCVHQTCCKLFDQACCKLTFADLMQLVSSTCIKFANANLQQAWFQQAWFQQACCKLMTSTSLLQLVNNLQQAGKIRNLQQVCGVSGCVHEINFKRLRLAFL